MKNVNRLSKIFQAPTFTTYITKEFLSVRIIYFKTATLVRLLSPEFHFYQLTPDGKTFSILNNGQELGQLYALKYVLSLRFTLRFILTVNFYLTQNVALATFPFVSGALEGNQVEIYSILTAQLLRAIFRFVNGRCQPERSTPIEHPCVTPVYPQVLCAIYHLTLSTLTFS